MSKKSYFIKNDSFGQEYPRKQLGQERLRKATPLRMMALVRTSKENYSVKNIQGNYSIKHDGFGP